MKALLSQWLTWTSSRNCPFERKASQLERAWRGTDEAKGRGSEGKSLGFSGIKESQDTLNWAWSSFTVAKVGRFREFSCRYMIYIPVPLSSWECKLAGGNSKIVCFFTPDFFGKMNPFWQAYDFKWLGSTTIYSKCNAYFLGDCPKKVVH